MFKNRKNSEANAIGAELAAALPNDGIPWYRKPHLRKLVLCLFLLFLFSSANGYDGSMMNGLQALPQWHVFMDNPTGAWLGFINAVQSLGAIVCFPFVVWSNGRFGRKKTIAVGYFWLVVGVTLQTAARDHTMFVIGRLMIGGVSAFFGSSVPLLMTETAYPTHRGLFTAFYNCGWYVGSLVAAWATFGTRNYAGSWAWRVPSICQAIIPLVGLPGLLMSGESPRWLISVGREEEARQFLIKSHAGGDQQSRLAAYEFDEIKRTLALEILAKKNSSYADMFRGKGNKHRTFITITLGIFAQWNGVVLNKGSQIRQLFSYIRIRIFIYPHAGYEYIQVVGIASYYLAPVLITVGITSVTQQTLISAFLQLWNLILAVGAAFSVDTFGRRRLFLVSCFGMLCSYILISGLSGSFATTGNSSTGVAVIPFLFLFYGFYDIAFTPLAIAYPCEIWPFTYRARGLAMEQLATQLAVFFNIFVNPIALDAIKWKYYVVYVAMLVIITVTIWFTYPETKGHSLEEMARIFDGDNAAVPRQGSVSEEVEKRASFSQVEEYGKSEGISRAE